MMSRTRLARAEAAMATRKAAQADGPASPGRDASAEEWARFWVAFNDPKSGVCLRVLREVIEANRLALAEEGIPC